MKSLWQDVTFPKLSSLNKNECCDILIIGGGIAGISTLFELKDLKEKIMLIDKGKIGMGVTSKTTGKLTFLQELNYQKIKEAMNEESAKLYLESQKDAIKNVESIIQKYQIDCGFEKVDSYVFTNQKKEINKFHKEEALLKKWNVPFYIVKELPISFPCTYGIKVSDTAVFHPLKYLSHLCKILKEDKIPIYENTCAQKISKKDDNYIIQTNHGTISAKKVIVCTHYPFFIIPGFIPFKTHLEKDYICAKKGFQNQPFSAITNTSPIHSIRYQKDHLIYLGNSLKTNQGLNEEKEYGKILKNFRKYFSETPDYIWSNHDIITTDYLPIIGRLKDQLYIATGFNTWGMTNGVLAGMILSDLIKGKKNPYESLVSPHRKMSIQKCIQGFQDFLQNTDSILKTKIQKQKEFYPKNVIMKKNIGIFIDQNGKEHRIQNQCPHMKCSLIFNTIDQTWDCPCHGSRFDIDGNVLKGPSVFSIKK